jgi:hypothetical protein
VTGASVGMGYNAGGPLQSGADYSSILTDPGHYHNTSITVSGSGTSGTAASLPAYLALAYIMKV